MGDYFLILIFAITFLLGSIPWGVIVSRLFYRIDIRKHGSGNIGTTNAMRSLGKIGGGSVFLLDFSKGLLAGIIGLLLAMQFGLTDEQIIGYKVFVAPEPFYLQTALALSLFGAALGHIFSPWLKFRGGKGIAVAVGCVLITYGWLPTLIELAVFVLCVIVTRRVSVGSIAAAFVCPILGIWLFWGNIFAIMFTIALGAVIIWAHRGNIVRLKAGTEPKIGSRLPRKQDTLEE